MIHFEDYYFVAKVTFKVLKFSQKGKSLEFSQDLKLATLLTNTDNLFV